MAGLLARAVGADPSGATRTELLRTARDLVCSANLAFLEGVAGALPRAGRRAVLDPRPGRCCVALVS